MTKQQRVMPESPRRTSPTTHMWVVQWGCKHERGRKMAGRIWTGNDTKTTANDPGERAVDLTTTYEPSPMFRASWVCRFQLPNGAQRESWGESAAEAIEQAETRLAEWEAGH